MPWATWRPSTSTPVIAVLRGTLSALLITAIAGCTSLVPSSQSRHDHALNLAHAAEWKSVRIKTEPFILTGFLPQAPQRAKTLTVYIEGDGLAWISGSRSSGDPTPINPVGLELAMRHPYGAAAYLARPWQFIADTDRNGCEKHVWTAGRYSGDVVEASSQALDALMAMFGAVKLRLVGYSGGGAVAALLAARRNDVIQLVTVAGMLDHQSWTREHQITPLHDSLNPADFASSLLDLPQLHLIGGKDKNVTEATANSYRARFPASHQPQVKRIEAFDHSCCWVRDWPELAKLWLP